MDIFSLFGFYIDFTFSPYFRDFFRCFLDICTRLSTLSTSSTFSPLSAEASFFLRFAHIYFFKSHAIIGYVLNEKNLGDNNEYSNGFTWRSFGDDDGL